MNFNIFALGEGERVLPLAVAIALVALYLGFLLALAETLNRVVLHQGELTRKLVHIGSGQVVLLAWWLHIPAWVGVVAGLIAALVAILSYFLPILPSLESVGRRSGGTLFYALSLGGLMGYFFSQGQPQFAAIGVLVMTWGDGLAGLIGQRWGRHPYRMGGQKKSIEGSLVMAVTSFAVTLTLLASLEGINIMTTTMAGAVALAATVLESFSWWGIDNLTVPVGAAFLSFALWNLWGC